MSQPEAMLHLPEEEFDKALPTFDDKGLLDVVVLLQGEMAAEQERFEDLTNQLALIPDQDEEYDDVSADLMESQARLAMLMGRNMKCFTQQATNQTKDLRDSSDDDSSPEGYGHRSLLNGHSYKDSDDERYSKSKPSIKPQGFTLKFNGEQSHSDKRLQNGGEHHGGKGHNSQPNSSAESSNEVITVNRMVTETTFKVRTPKHPSEQDYFLGPSRPCDRHEESEKLTLEKTDREKLERSAISEIEAMMTSLNNESCTDDAGNDDLREGDADDVGRDDLREGDAVDGHVPVQYVKTDAASAGRLYSDSPTAAEDYKYDAIVTNGSEEEEEEPREGEPEISSYEASFSSSMENIAMHKPSYSSSLEDVSGKRKSSLTLKLSSGSTSSTGSNNSPGHKKRVCFLVDDLDIGETSSDPFEAHTDAKVPLQTETENCEIQSDNHSSSIEPLPSELQAKSRVPDTVQATGVILATDPSSIQSHTAAEFEAGSTLQLQDAADAEAVAREHLNDLQQTRMRGHATSVPSQASMGCSISLPIHKAENHGDPLPAAPVVIDGITGDEKIQDRVTLRNWDPRRLLHELYEVRLEHDAEPEPHKYLEMEGFMEKLPINKKKATLLKTWKRRYFKTKEGFLHYYENRNCESSSGFMQLSGGSVEDLGTRMIGLDDGRGRYLVVRCAADKEFENWMRVLQTHVVENAKLTYVRPVLQSNPHRRKKVVIIDMGSCSIRAGLLCESATLPQLFFPSLTASDKQSGKHAFGFDALRPDVRSRSSLSYAVRPSVKVDQCAIDMSVMPGLFEKIFTDLKVDPSQYWVMFSSPGNFSDHIKEQFMNMLIKNFHVMGVNIMNQSLLALYSYGATSGIVVDIGERLEIVPVTDGYIAEAGVTRQPYGGHRVTESLNASFTESRYRFFTDVEFQIVRLAMEKTCFVSSNYNEDLKRCTHAHPEEYRATLDLTSYDLPKGTWTHVTHDVSRFKSPEGLFNMDVWEMDNPPLQKLVQKAVQACPMDMRREMWRSVFLSGGLTKLPGFAERLQKELQKLVPGSITVQVHGSPQRYHSAYIGACTLANFQQFETSCITSKEWQELGARALRKWHMY